MPTAWTDELKPKKAAKPWAVMVAGTNWRDDLAFVDAVDAETGEHVANLLRVTPRGYEICLSARDRLAEGGYDVETTAWDERGGLRAAGRFDFPPYTMYKGERASAGLGVGLLGEVGRCASCGVQRDGLVRYDGCLYCAPCLLKTASVERDETEVDSRPRPPPTPGVAARSARAEKGRDGTWTLRFGFGVDEYVVFLCETCSGRMAGADKALREAEGILPPAPPERT